MHENRRERKEIQTYRTAALRPQIGFWNLLIGLLYIGLSCYGQREWDRHFRTGKKTTEEKQRQNEMKSWVKTNEKD